MATTTTTNNNNSQGAAALALASIAAEGLAWALRAVVAPALALLLTVCGYRPSRPARPALKPAKAAQPAPAPARPIEALPVRELRQLARAAGFKKLARSGRRDQLLTALA